MNVCMLRRAGVGFHWLWVTTSAVERIPRTPVSRRGGGGVKIPFHPGRDIANDWNSAQERLREEKTATMN